MEAARSPTAIIAEIAAGLRTGRLVPYLGPEAPLLEAANAELPLLPEKLVERLTKRVAVPSRIRRNLTAAAQYIENFRHRKVLRSLMLEALAQPALPTGLHRLLAALPLPLIVDTGYDAATAAALQGRDDWGQIQGVSRAEVRGETWTAAFDAAGTGVDEARAATWTTLLYKPLGSVAPAGNFIVSDSDFVEVLTEIDIQTPIPAEVQRRRGGRSFLFLGCRFDNQLARSYARQILKRSGGGHVAVLAEPPTRNETKFLAEQGIGVVPMGLADFTAGLEAAV